MSEQPGTTGGAASKLLFLIERGRFEEAGRLLGKALRADPEDLRLRYAGALLDFEQGNLDRSDSDTRKLLLRYPGNEAVRYLLFRIALERPDEQNALEQISTLCKLDSRKFFYLAEITRLTKQG